MLYNFEKLKAEKIENFKCEAGASDSEPTIDSYWEAASSLPNVLGELSNLIRLESVLVQ